MLRLRYHFSLAALALVLPGCKSSAGSDECRVTSSTNGAQISCPDGSVVNVSPSESPSCSVEGRPDGAVVVNCVGSEAIVLTPGKVQPSCQVAKDRDENPIVICDDGTTAVLPRGREGKQGLAGPAGPRGERGSQGPPGAPGESASGCSIVPGEGTVTTIDCGDLGAVTVQDLEKVVPGNLTIQGLVIVSNSADTEALLHTEHIDGDLVVAVPGISEVILPALRSVSGSIVVPTKDRWFVDPVNQIAYSGVSKLKTLSLPSLESVGGSIDVYDTPIETLHMPSIVKIEGRLVLTLTGLSTVSLPLLHSISGGLFVGSNKSLVSMNLPSLQNPMPTVAIKNNPELAECFVISFFGASLVEGENLVVSGNRPDCSCSGDGLSTTFTCP
jgi:hypothetical protein